MGKRTTPRWIRTAVDVRDEGRCMFRVGDNRVCGRTTQLYVERRRWAQEGVWDPDDYQLTCVYHLRDGVGLRLVDWCGAGRA